MESSGELEGFPLGIWSADGTTDLTNRQTSREIRRLGSVGDRAQGRLIPPADVKAFYRARGFGVKQEEPPGERHGGGTRQTHLAAEQGDFEQLVVD